MGRDQGGVARHSGAGIASAAARGLRFTAGLRETRPCQGNADANGSGGVDSIDAALSLQVVAGLVSNLPP